MATMMYFTLEGTVYCKPVLVFFPLTDSDIKPEMECFKICVGNLCVSRAMGFSHSGGQCDQYAFQYDLCFKK